MTHSVKYTSLIALALLMLSVPFNATAQDSTASQVSVEDLSKPQEEIYRGIIPGKRNELSHLDKKSKKYNVISWIGFVPEETRTRVFFQATDSTDYTMDTSEDGSKITLTFPNTKVENYNLVRFIDASFFDRKVKRIDASRKGKTLTVVLTVTPGARPNVSRENGYIYMDFSHEL